MTAREAAVHNAAQTPMREHVERFWRLLETEHVRILVEIRRDHSSIPYWDSSSFPDDIAKVIADDHRALQSHEAAPAATLSDSDDAYATALRCAWDCWTTRTEKDLAAFDFSLQHAVGILQMAALSAPVGADWRTIDSAPKDGTAILVSIGPDDQVVVFYHAPKADAPSHCWQQANGVAYHKDAPTHWMPLPAAPKPEGE